MPDLRYDPVNDQWIAIAENRIGRPSEFEPSARPNPLVTCPFCAGNEASTPPSIAIYDDDCQFPGSYPSSSDSLPRSGERRGSRENGRSRSAPLAALRDAGRKQSSTGDCPPPWITRVIPNRFPAFGAEAPGIALQLVNSIAGTPYAASGSETNYQELIIESSRHVAGYSELNSQELEFAFLVYRDRLLALQQEAGIKHAMLFKNCRYEAGASLSHVHSQLIAMDFVPPAIEAKCVRLAQVGEQNPSQLVLKKIAEFETRERVRVVSETDDWVAFCPFSSRFAFQVWIVAKSNMGPYWTQTNQQLRELSELTRSLVVALESALEFPAYNVLFHNPPFGRKNHSGQSYVELFARVSNPAGFEWGTNCWINPVSPESASQRLREFL